MALGFSRCASDHWVWSQNGKVIVPAYVDDLTLACKHIPTLKRIKEELKKQYMHDLGPIKYILGIEVTRDRANRKMYLSQRKHAGLNSYKRRLPSDS